jgi:hypothetical protein
MNYLMINNTDISHLVKGLKVGYETLVSEDSGRNANGDTVVDIINRKVKIYVSFRPMTNAEMYTLLNAISGYVVNVSYLDPKTRATKTVQCYTGTPNPEYMMINSRIIFKEFNLNFIEM